MQISCLGGLGLRNETGQCQCDVEPPVGVACDAPAELQCTVRVLGPSQFSLEAFQSRKWPELAKDAYRSIAGIVRHLD